MSTAHETEQIGMIKLSEGSEMLNDIINLYASDSKPDRVKADRQIRELASSFNLDELTAMLLNPASSLPQRTVAALAIGYHPSAGQTELEMLFEALRSAVGEPSNYAYRIMSGIRKLLSKDVSSENIGQFYKIIHHYKAAGGSDTSAVAIQIEGLLRRGGASSAAKLPKEDKVFLVHGHDETLLSQTAQFLERLGLEVIVLREQPGNGRTIIEKLEHNSDVRFAIVLLTPDDVGKSVREVSEGHPRARQNVIFELGYFIGKLGWKNVSVLYRESVELPSDNFGIEYIKIDDGNTWRFRLATELKAAGLPVDLVSQEQGSKLKIFLCHSSDDKQRVKGLYKKLQKNNADVWLDSEKLLPGQDWETEIAKAVKETDIVIICLSKNSVSKSGYIQRELRYALNVADEKPDGTIFIIPLKLEECTVPDRLAKWQWLNYHEANAYAKLLSTLKVRAKQLGVEL